MSSTATDGAENAALLSLQVRLHLLETLVAGSTSALEAASSSNERSLARRRDDFMDQLRSTVETPGYEAIRRFLEYYDSFESFLLQGSSVNGADNDIGSLDLEAKTQIVLDSGPLLQSLRSDLLQIEALQKHDVAGAGNLASHETLRPTLQCLATDLVTLSSAYTDLETQVTALADKYDSQVHALSELFLEWHKVISDVEKKQARTTDH